MFWRGLGMGHPASHACLSEKCRDPLRQMRRDPRHEPTRHRIDALLVPAKADDGPEAPLALQHAPEILANCLREPSEGDIPRGLDLLEMADRNASTGGERKCQRQAPART